MVDKKARVKSKESRVATKVKIAKSKQKKEASKDESRVTSNVSRVDKPEELKPDTARDSSSSKTATAKAGRRSAKSIAEAKAEQARQERIKSGKAAEEKPKVSQKPPRSRIERTGKKYREIAKLIEKDKQYSLPEALELAVKTSTVKFDATVELHVNLGIDPKVADQNVRGNVTLPAGTGKNLRIAVFAEGDEVAKAKAAGADIAGEADLLAQLDKGEINFDVLITSPNLMARLSKYAKLLGPKGLMPNPKSGTITADVPKAIKEAKSGRLEYRVDPAGIIHLGIGKVSFGSEKLNQNAEAVLASVRSAKPSNLKAVYINSIFVTTSMGPSIKVAI